MNKIQKGLALFLSGILLTGAALTGCGSSTDTQPAQPEKQTLVVGISTALAPYAYEENGKITGVDAEVAAAIADKMGMQLQLVNMAADTIPAAVLAGKVDVGMGEIVADTVQEKMPGLSFSDPYATDEQTVLVRKDSVITDLEKLAGHAVGVKKGTSGQLYSQSKFGKGLVKEYATGAAAVTALQSKQVDTVILDTAQAKKLLDGQKLLKALPEKFVESDYTIALRKDDGELRDKINKAIGDLIDEGKVQKILDKYTGPEETVDSAKDSTK